MVTLLFSLIGCSEDVYENHTHSNSGKDEISFKQFISETGITKFDYYKKANVSNSTDIQARTIESEFITDTIGIKKYVNPVDSKTTYSFKIYPITEALESKEYYNLVYEKYGNEWNEIIFFNTEKSNPTDARKLESSEMVYNRISGREGFSEVITYSIQCDGSCNGVCDGFACPTGQCIKTTITYVYTGIQDTSGGFNGNPTNSGNPSNSDGGGDPSNGIFIPNPYDGDADLNNPDFVFVTQVAAFTRTLPNNLKNLMTNILWIYPNIVDFMRNNGGLTQENKDAVIFALTNSIPILNLHLPNWTFTEINQLHYNTFVFLLQNPNNTGSNFIEQIITNSNDLADVNYPQNIINNIQKPCQKDIIKNITSISSPFTNLINQTFNSSDKVNVKFYNGNNPNGNPAYTNPILEGTPDNFIVKIRFDNNYLDNATDLSIIAVTLHELVHAYLIALYVKGELVATNAEYNTLQNAFMAFYNEMVEDTFVQTDNEIHNAMKNFMEQMANSIYNYALSKDISVTPEYCKNLAWGTMTGTDLFQETLTSDEQIISNNTAAYEQDNLPQAKGTGCN